VRILELLKDGEQTVGKLQSELGIDSSGASQHLAAMRRQGLLESRREGTSVYYRVRDPRTFQLLETARQLISSHLEEARVLLGELGDSPHATRKVTSKRR
jgi:ArsR family transcriptional regulator